MKKYHYTHIPKVITINKVFILSTFFFVLTSCSSIFNKEPVEYKPVQYAKNDYRVLKKDALDLPDQVWMKRIVPMTTEQLDAYMQMKRTALVQLKQEIQ